MDPAQTITRIFLYFYFMINVGSLLGQIVMVYAEKYVGFWLSFVLPTIMFALCPLVLYVCRKNYEVTPPTGSVVGRGSSSGHSRSRAGGHGILSDCQWKLFTPH